MEKEIKNCHKRSLEALGVSESVEAVAKSCLQHALANHLTVNEFDRALEYAKLLSGRCELTT